MNRRFKNMEIWQLAFVLVNDVYVLIDELPEYENNNLKSQLRRAVTSIPLNIAEGSASPSNRDFFNYLTYAYKSAKEVFCIFDLCNELNYFSDEDYSRVYQALDKLTAKLYGFMKNIEKRCNYDSKSKNQGYKKIWGKDYRAK